MDKVLREQLVAFLTTAQAHMTFSDAVQDFPKDRMNDKPPHGEYTPWQLLEHIRLTQADLVAFLNDAEYSEPSWPKDYWPISEKRADESLWKKSITGYEKDLQKLVQLISDTTVDFSAKAKNGSGQTILRELLLAIDHTSYHIGEFAILRQVMQTWQPGHK